MLSFAQYQRDHDVVRLQARLARRRTEYNDRLAQSRSPYGDIDEYRSAQKSGRSETGEGSVQLDHLRPGDVVYTAVGAYRGPVVVASTAHRSGGLRLSVVTASGKLATMSPQEFVGDGSVVGTVVMPGSFSPHRKEFRQETARRLKRAKLRPEGARTSRSRRSAAAHGGHVHPVELDPDLKKRLKAAEDAERRAKELARLEHDISNRRGSLGRDFDGVVSVMTQMGFLDEKNWLLTDDGRVLARIFHESDLLVVEALRTGIFDGLSPAELAGLVSTIVYEYRGPDDPPSPWFPTRELQERFRKLEALSVQIDVIEGKHGLSAHRPPDPGFLALAHGWCSGVELADLVDDGELAGGDIVRNLRQVIDLCRQLGDVSPDPGIRQAARSAVAMCTRGVVVDVASSESTGTEEAVESEFVEETA
jgi:ATP-dependent RNA helicase HelY